MQCIEKYGEPDEITITTDDVELLIYYSGKGIMSGYGIFKAPIHKERHVFAIKNNKIIDEYQVIQVKEGSRWMCGNISGHGDFCGSWYQQSCNQYNSTNTLSCGLRVIKNNK